jgi:hypothetical protein
MRRWSVEISTGYSVLVDDFLSVVYSVRVGCCRTRDARTRRCVTNTGCNRIRSICRLKLEMPRPTLQSSSMPAKGVLVWSGLVWSGNTAVAHALLVPWL